MLRNMLYRYISPFLEKCARLLNQRGIKPLHLTLTGLLITTLGFLFYAEGYLYCGSWVIIVASLFDMMDGPLARVSGKATNFGAFIDSVIDRYSDFLIFGGLLVYFARLGQANMCVLTFIVIIGSMLTSYTKARAESFMGEFHAGFFERPERIAVICAGGLFGVITPALYFLAFATHLTALQRIHYAWKHLER